MHTQILISSEMCTKKIGGGFGRRVKKKFYSFHLTHVINMLIHYCDANV
jgi:hypothetical protein